MKKKYRLFAVILAMLMALAFVGCQTDSDSHEHSFSEEWKWDETYHWHETTCEHSKEKGDKAAHAFGEWTVIENITKENEGKRERSCSVCSYKEEQDIPHEFGEWMVIKESTCTEGGSRNRTCEKCGYEETETIAAHFYSDVWMVIQAPTKESKGKKERTCTECSYKEELSIPKIPEGFVYVSDKIIIGKSNTNNYSGVFIEGRTVTLSDFYMSEYEVTQDEYRLVMTEQKVTVSGTEYTLNANPSYCTEGSSSYAVNFGSEQGKRPVEGITWYDAVYYCNVLSEKEGLTPAYEITVMKVKDGNITEATVTLVDGANGYRLPTEAEWEYAARGGNPSVESWDYTFSGASGADGKSYSSLSNSGLDDVGWYCYNNDTGTTGSKDVTNNASGKGTHQIGQKTSNSLGIYDMSGNVWEWCYDLYIDSVSTETETDPKGPLSGSCRVMRGGSWIDYAYDASVFLRTFNIPSFRSSSAGFRVVRSAK